MRLLYRLAEWWAPALVAILFVCLTAMMAITIYTIWEFTQLELIQVSKTRSEFGTLPPDCWHLYNRGLTEEWVACMGVEYK